MAIAWQKRSDPPRNWTVILEDPVSVLKWEPALLAAGREKSQPYLTGEGKLTLLLGV